MDHYVPDCDPQITTVLIAIFKLLDKEGVSSPQLISRNLA